MLTKSQDNFKSTKMEAEKKIQEIHQSIHKIKTCFEGIKILKTVGTSTCLAPQQLAHLDKFHNLKVLKRIIKVNNIIKDLNEFDESLKSAHDIKKPEFSNTESDHPLNFLEDLTAYFEKIPVEYRTIKTILDCLNGDAANWAIIYTERWANIKDFKKDFLDQYWGQAEQSKLKRDIVSGAWDNQGTMLQHFAYLVGQAKWLPRTALEEELTFDIMRHFPQEVQKAWAQTQQSTVLEATAFLKMMDDKALEMCEDKE